MSTGFSHRQLRKLATPIDPARVHARVLRDKTLSYIEGWFAISEANRIFGYDGWDREMVHFERVYERKHADGVTCGYAARVRVRVRANSTEILREGTGFGSASAESLGEAHERALKAAETDATKRALATFGGRFGLMLYDNKQTADRNGVAARGLTPPGTHRSLADGSGAHDTPRTDGVMRAPEPKVTAKPSVGNGSASPNPANDFGRDTTGKRFRLVTPDGHVSEGLSGEAFCSGLRQMIEAVRDEGELDTLLHKNREMMELVRALPGLTTMRGKHYVAVLERLAAARRKAIGVSLCDTQAGSDPAFAKSAVGERATSDIVRDVSAPEHAMPEPEKPDGIVAATTGTSETADAMVREDNAGAQIPPCPVRAYQPYMPVPAYPLAAAIKQFSGRNEKETSDQLAARANGNLSEPSRPIHTPLPSPPTLTRISQITGKPSIDKSVLAIASDRRIRSKAHLVHVAAKPCLICEEMPCHAHHLTFAQGRGLAQKVSDEFTVPLCVAHHNELHLSGSEIAWWRRQGIDPLAIARALWVETSAEVQAPADPGAHPGAAP